jgi:hypothetical protein
VNLKRVNHVEIINGTIDNPTTKNGNGYTAENIIYEEKQINRPNGMDIQILL